MADDSVESSIKAAPQINLINQSPRRYRHVEINWDEAEKIAGLGPSKEVLADYLGVSVQVLDLRCKKEYGLTGLEFIQRFMAPMKMRLLSVAIEEAIKKRNSTLLIFLLKNYCDMTDRKEVKEVATTAQAPQVSIMLPPQIQAELDKLEARPVEDATVTDTKEVKRKRKTNEATKVNMREEEAQAERERVKDDPHYKQAVFSPEEEAAMMAEIDKAVEEEEAQKERRKQIVEKAKATKKANAEKKALEPKNPEPPAEPPEPPIDYLAELDKNGKVGEGLDLGE